MADQPARALIVYGDGFMRHVAPRHSHLHAIAAAGSCGFLALRSQGPTVDEDERVVGELAQLLDLHDFHQKNAGNKDNGEQMPSMSERFMKIKAGMLSTCSPAAAFGEKAGFTLLNWQDVAPGSSSHSLAEPSATAVRLLSFLDLHDPNDHEKLGDFELLLLHLKVSQQNRAEREDELVDWTDKLLGALREQTTPGTNAGSHLYLLVVLGYGSVDASEDEVASILPENSEPKLAELMPRQSYTIKAAQPIEGIRDHHPLLAVYHLNAVTRLDEVDSFTFDEFKQHAGNLTILVDRFLHEVAFKLWRAPKYGA
ncbi:hypothetical protein Mapa_009944 [Marchantia paleacea]|nr:hypothetical protein Mapa_009944 [Marchantia paleacea]